MCYNDTLIKTIEYRGYTIEAHYDEFSSHPMDWHSQFYEMYKIAHSRYFLGEKEKLDYYSDFLECFWDTSDPNLLFFPFTLYSVSSSHVRLTVLEAVDPKDYEPHDLFAGFLVTYRPDWEKFWGKGSFTAKSVENQLDMLFEELNQYYAGECYLIEVKSSDGETEETLGGFLGSDNIEKYIQRKDAEGEWVPPLTVDGYAVEQGKGIIDNIKKAECLEHQNKVKQYIKNRVPLVYRKALKA